MATAGPTTPGIHTETQPVNYIAAGLVQIPVAGIASKISSYCRGRYNTVRGKCKIYRDVGGTPGALIAESAEIDIGTAFGWYEFSLNSIPLTPGFYWLALHCNDEIQIRWASQTGTMAVTWASGEPIYPVNPNPFVQEDVTYGPEIRANCVMSINITYAEGGITYGLTISVNDTVMGTTIPAPGQQFYNAGVIVEVSAIPNSGYVFDHWQLDGTPVGSASPILVTMDANHTLLAVFRSGTETRHILTVIANSVQGTTNPLPGAYSILEGQIQQVTAIANPGFKFDFWELDGYVVGSANPYEVVMNRAHTLTAIFVATEGFMAATGQVNDIQAAVNQASAAGGGDVYVPVGRWSNVISGSSQVKVPGGVNVFGLGSIGTKNSPESAWATALVAAAGSSEAGFIVLDGSNGKNSRISGFAFIGRYETNPPWTPMNSVIVKDMVDFRVDHCFARWMGNDLVGIEGESSGVVDHCACEDMFKGNGVEGTDYHIGYGVGYDRTYAKSANSPLPSWWRPITEIFGKYGLGIVYVEDCSMKRVRHGVVTYAAGSVVIRHCLFDEMSIYYASGFCDCHGAYPDGVWGGRSLEAYKNVFLNSRTNPHYNDWNLAENARAVKHRGGAILFWGNEIHDMQAAYCFSSDDGNPSRPQCYPQNTFIWSNTLVGVGTLYDFDVPSGHQVPQINVHFFLRQPTAVELPGYVQQINETGYPFTYPHPRTYGETPQTQFLLKIQAGEGGTTAPTPGSYLINQGQTLPVTALPNTNYRFLNWLLDGVSKDQNPISVVMGANHELEAIFEYVEQPEETVTVRGTVKEQAGNMPVNGAVVTLNGYSQITGADGAFEFLDIPAQQYTLTVTKEGFQKASASINGTQGGTLQVDVILKPVDVYPSLVLPLLIIVVAAVASK